MSQMKDCKPIEVELLIPELELYLGKTLEKGYREADPELSLTSTNPVQNKVVTKALNDLEEYVDQRASEKVDLTSIVQDMEAPSNDTILSSSVLQTLIEGLNSLISQKAPIISPRFSARLDLDSISSVYDGARALVSGEGNQIIISLGNYSGTSDIILRGLQNPINPNDVATKDYVDNLALVDSEEEV